MLTDAHRKRRRRYIGASDVAPIIGVSPWNTASDVYYNKTAEFEVKDSGTKATNAGVLLEGSVIDFAAQTLDVKVKRNQFRVHKDIKWASATLDAMIVNSNEGIEAKTTSMPAGWGEERTDQIPIYYIAQCQWQMLVADLERVWVPCFMPDYSLDFKLYVVERDDAVIAKLLAECTRFWEDHVLKEVPPPHTTPAPRTIQRMKRVPEKVVPIEGSLVENYKKALEVSKDASKALKEAKMKMLEGLGDAEVGRYDGGVVNYRKRKRKAYKKSVSESTYRSLEVKEEHND